MRSWHLSSAGWGSPQPRSHKSMRNMEKSMLVAKGPLHRSNNILTPNTQNYPQLPERCEFLLLFGRKESPRQKKRTSKTSGEKAWDPGICINLVFISSPDTHPLSFNPPSWAAALPVPAAATTVPQAIHLVKPAYHTTEEGMPFGTRWQCEHKDASSYVLIKEK